MKETKRRLAFIKNGLFSYINCSVREQLTAQFPDLELEEIDIWNDVLKAKRSVYWIAVAHAAMRYGRNLIAHRHALPQIALRTPYLFRRVRELIAERLGEHLGEYRFTFQTQSLFDASLPGVPHFVFTDHTHLANLRYPSFRRAGLFPAPWTLLEPDIYHHARHIFVMSDHVRESLCSDYGIASDRVTTVFGGSNIEVAAIHLTNDRYQNRTVIFVGVDWERKGGPTLAQAVQRLHKEIPDVRLVVVGCKPNLSQSWCEEIGKIPREELKHHLARASVFCLPTLVEPFGVAVIEAFHCRLPVVATNVGAMPTLVRHGETGLIVPPDDPIALAEALRTLLTDPEKCRSFGESGFQDVRERYSWPVVGRKIRDGIETALRRT